MRAHLPAGGQCRYRGRASCTAAGEARQSPSAPHHPQPRARPTRPAPARQQGGACLGKRPSAWRPSNPHLARHQQLHTSSPPVAGRAASQQCESPLLFSSKCTLPFSMHVALSTHQAPNTPRASGTRRPPPAARAPRPPRPAPHLRRLVLAVAAAARGLRRHKNLAPPAVVLLQPRAAVAAGGEGGRGGGGVSDRGGTATGRALAACPAAPASTYSREREAHQTHPTCTRAPAPARSSGPGPCPCRARP